MKKLLVAIDGSEHAWKALDLAADIARAQDAEILLLHVVPYEPVPPAFLDFIEAEHIPLEEGAYAYHYSGRELGDLLTNKAADRLRQRGLEKLTPMMLEGHVARTILATASEEGVDAIFLGSRGLSDLKGALLGSVSHKVANLAPCTCVTVT